jgi:multidrug transporter EmrE-like cation transporter
MIKSDWLDVFIKQVNWKIGTFSLLPIAFGAVMAFMDVIMMFTAKFVHLHKISYPVGLAVATAVYAVEPYLFFRSMNYESMTAMNLIWDLSSDIVVTLAGLFVFGESIKGLRWIAIAMSIISLGLFAYTEE